MKWGAICLYHRVYRSTHEGFIIKQYKDLHTLDVS